MARKNSHGPFMVSVHDLVTHPGDARELSFEAPAPVELGVRLIGVPEGSPIVIEGQLESVHEGILASGTVQAEAAGECGRCLEPITRELEVEFQELFAYSVEEAFDFFVEDETIDLEEVVRDAVVLALPFQPVCREDCPGLCAVCGARLADDPGHTHEPVVDPRWSALAELRRDTE